MAAPLPPRIIEKSLVSDRVIVDAIIGKYSNYVGFPVMWRSAPGWA
jgi:hypothetical protein